MHLRSKFATAAFLSLVMAGPAVVAAMDNGSSTGIAAQEKKGNSHNQGQRGNSGNHGNRGGNNGSGGEDLTHIRFAALDTNHDGQITRDEWRGNQNSFNQHDWNGDGVLSGIEVTPGAQRPGGTQGSTFDRLDTNRDGRISLSEWTGDRATFDRLDTNHDGFLTRAELQNNTGTQGNNTFDRLDTNRDGRIALSEWRGPRAAFDRLDANRDGFLSRDEFQNTTGGRRDHFSLLDTNGDGRLSLTEWTGDRATFDRLDANHDGFLSREEFTGLRNDSDDDDNDDDDGR